MIRTSFLYGLHFKRNFLSRAYDKNEEILKKTAAIP